MSFLKESSAIKSFLVIITLIFALLVVASVASGDFKDNEMNPDKPASFTADQLSDLLNNLDYPAFLDIRTPGEWDQTGIIDGAEKVNFYSNAFEAKINDLDPSKPIVLYCRTDNRSGQAAQKLTELGFESVWYMKGGIMDWKKGNREIVEN
jgi:rhodanese-related sulfurtransferase